MPFLVHYNTDWEFTYHEFMDVPRRKSKGSKKVKEFAFNTIELSIITFFQQRLNINLLWVIEEVIQAYLVSWTCSVHHHCPLSHDSVWLAMKDHLRSENSIVLTSIYLSFIFTRDTCVSLINFLPVFQIYGFCKFLSLFGQLLLCRGLQYCTLLSLVHSSLEELPRKPS